MGPEKSSPLIPEGASRELVDGKIVTSSPGIYEIMGWPESAVHVDDEVSTLPLPMDIHVGEGFAVLEVPTTEVYGGTSIEGLSVELHRDDMAPGSGYRIISMADDWMLRHIFETGDFEPIDVEFCADPYGPGGRWRHRVVMGMSADDVLRHLEFAGEPQAERVRCDDVVDRMADIIRRYDVDEHEGDVPEFEMGV